MRCFRGLFGALVACGVLVVASPLRAKAPTPVDGVPPEALKAVQGVLPKGWTATARGVTLTIKRDKKVGLHNPIGAPPSLDGKPSTPTFREPYEITLRFRPRLPAEAVEKMRKENDETGKKLDAMRDRLRAAQISHKFDDWLPSTPEQKKLVADYRAMQKAMPYHRLPDYYTETNSIDLDDSVGFFLAFSDEAEAKECNGVKEKIRKLFKPHAHADE